MIVRHDLSKERYLAGLPVKHRSAAPTKGKTMLRAALSGASLQPTTRTTPLGARPKVASDQT
jgi:hypothetical protein